MEILSYWRCWAVGKMQYVKKQRGRDTVKALAQTVMHGWVHSDEVMGDWLALFSSTRSVVEAGEMGERTKMKSAKNGKTIK